MILFLTLETRSCYILYGRTTIVTQTLVYVHCVAYTKIS